jgi:F-type H+-transporting ATPase subunit b
MNLFAVAGIPEIMQQLFPNLPNFIAHVLATIIIIILLTYLVYKPYRNFIDQRRVKINELLDDAVDKQTQAAIDEKKAQRLLDDAKNESALMIKNAQIDAQAQRNQILQTTNLEVTNLQNQAKNTIEKSRLEAEHQIKKDIVTIAFQAAEKLLDENLTNEKNQKIIDEFINNLDKDQ